MAVTVDDLVAAVEAAGYTGRDSRPAVRRREAGRGVDETRRSVG